MGSVGAVREDEVDGTLKNGPGAAARNAALSPEIHGPHLGQQQSNAALSPGGAPKSRFGGLGVASSITS